MHAMEECSRKQTTLTGIQMDILENLKSIYPLVADLAHAYLTVYVKLAQEDRLLVLSQVKPHTSFGRYRVENVPGAAVQTAEEPMVWHTLSTGAPLKGKREWAWGYMMDMYTYPICDYNGVVIACVSFEMNWEALMMDGYDFLFETAHAMLMHAKLPFDTDMYRSMSANDGIMIADRRSKIVFANAAAQSTYKVLGIGELVGRHLFDREFTMHITKETTIGQKLYEKELEIGDFILLQRTIPIVKHDQLFREVRIISDVTELKKKEKELLIKSAVIQEIHHRVKNNLQTIASLLRLQARRTKSKEAKAALEESVNRILSISVVHEFLSQQDEEMIDVVEVAKNILTLIRQNLLDPQFQLETRFQGGTVILPSEHASSLALVINELIQNSLEHAFNGCVKGMIGLEITRTSKVYQIDLFDNGSGLPENFQTSASKSLGLQIVRTLIEDDLGGAFSLISENGTHARIVIPRVKGDR